MSEVTLSGLVFPEQLTPASTPAVRVWSEGLGSAKQLNPASTPAVRVWRLGVEVCRASDPSQRIRCSGVEVRGFGSCVLLRTLYNFFSTSKLSGNEVYHTIFLILLLKIMLCSKLHCQKLFRLKHISYIIGSMFANDALV